MNPLRYRAWQFLHPDIDLPRLAAGLVTSPDAGLGISPTGGIEMVEDHASVRQAIFLLVSTIPGERVMRPDYGCDLHKLIFSPNDNTTAGLAIYYVRQAIDRWEPRVQVTYIDADPHPEEPGRLDILLEYRLRRADRTEQITFSINLAGEGPDGAEVTQSR
jgi:phage baseplate assembly protein W